MQSKLFNQTPRWQSQRHPMPRALSHAWQAWLFDRRSLTERLIELSAGHFRVQVLSENWQLPMTWEQHALDLSPRHFARVREVALLCNDHPLVYARSVLPVSTLTGSNRHFKYLGSKPLGAALFNEPSLTRDPIAVAMIESLKPEPSITRQHPAYARCSIFYVHAKPLLVSEIFLPKIITYTAPYD